MKWRLLKLDWKYGLGELGIVTLGVLIALYVEQWNSERLERIEEVGVIERLIDDIDDDRSGIDLGESQIASKLPALVRLIQYSNNPSSIAGHEEEFLVDITAGANWGWSQRVARKTTYNELLGSGNFGIIKSAAIRNQLSSYYDFFDVTSRRTDERETEYPALSYKLSTITVSSRELSGSEIERTIASISSPETQQLILAEENFAYFAGNRLGALKDRNEELINALQEYLTEIE